MSFTNAQEATKLPNREQAIKDMQQVAMQFRTYQMLCGTLPTESEGISALVEKPKDASDRWKQLLRSIPSDPWGREYIYLIAPNTKYGYTIHSQGPDSTTKDDDIYVSE